MFTEQLNLNSAVTCVDGNSDKNDADNDDDDDNEHQPEP